MSENEIINNVDSKNKTSLDRSKILLGIMSDFCNERQSSLNIDNSTIDDKEKTEYFASYLISMEQLLQYVYAYQIDLDKYDFYVRKVNVEKAKHRFEKKENVLNKINEVLSKNNIKYFVAKGLEVAEYYPVPYVRMMCDIDLYVKEKEREHCAQILENNGFTIEEKSFKEWKLEYDGVSIELQTHLFYDELNRYKAIKRYMDGAWKHVTNVPNSSRYVLDWDYHFIYIVAHTFKHFNGNGVGFKQVMDIAMLAKNNNQLNWEKIRKTLDQIGLLDFCEKIFYIIHQEFKIEVPFCTVMDAVTYEEYFTKLIRCGAFGGSFVSHDEKLINNHGKIGAFMVRVFPTYEMLRYHERFSFLNNHPSRLVFAWIYRLVSFMFDKEKVQAANRFIKAMFKK